MKSVKQVAVFAENKPGQAARITKILAAASLNIRCITVASSGAYGVMKLLVNEPNRAADTLRKEGIAATLMEVLAVDLASAVVPTGRTPVPLAGSRPETPPFMADDVR